MNRFLSALALTIIGLAGCSSVPEIEAVRPVWPMPPEEPRIVFVNSYSGESSFQDRPSAFEIFLLGPPETSYNIELQKPYGIAAYGEKIYVADTQSRAIVVFDLTAKSVSLLGISGSLRLASPIGVAVNAAGDIFVSDPLWHKIYVYSNTGEGKMAIGDMENLKNPAGIAIDNRSQKLYVADSKGHEIDVFTLDGEYLRSFGKRGNGDGEFNYPSNLAIDERNGNVYVVDSMNFRVQVFDQEGNFLRKFGQVGTQLGCFSRPKGIAVDSEGHCYVVDSNFGNFQIFDDQGRLLLFVGTGGYGPGEFFLPAGIWIDGRDRVYVVDSWNGRVQVFQYLSEKFKQHYPEEYRKYLDEAKKPGTPQEN